MNVSGTSVKTEKQTYWAHHVKQYLASGKTQRNYCDQHELKLHQLVYWKRILSGPSKNNETGSTNGFIAIQVTQPADMSATHLTVELPNGIRIKGVHASNLNITREIIRWQS